MIVYYSIVLHYGCLFVATTCMGRLELQLPRINLILRERARKCIQWILRVILVPRTAFSVLYINSGIHIQSLFFRHNCVFSTIAFLFFMFTYTYMYKKETDSRFKTEKRKQRKNVREYPFWNTITLSIFNLTIINRVLFRCTFEIMRGGIR